MPELPEVETVRRGLHALVKGYTIADARQLHPRALKPESIAPLESLNGAKITITKPRLLNINAFITNRIFCNAGHPGVGRDIQATYLWNISLTLMKSGYRGEVTSYPN